MWVLRFTLDEHILPQSLQDRSGKGIFSLWLSFKCLSSSSENLNELGQWLHLYCLISWWTLCFSTSSSNLNIFLHCLHGKSKPASCTFIWLFNFSFVLYLFPHFSQVILWTNLCRINRILEGNDTWHLSQIKFRFVCVSKWYFNSHFLTKLLAHILHLCGRSPRCRFMCPLRPPDSEKSFPHIRHSCVFMPVCVRQWIARAFARLNDFGHSWHLNGLVSECTTKCFFRSPRALNFFWQVLQSNILSIVSPSSYWLTNCKTYLFAAETFTFSSAEICKNSE